MSVSSSTVATRRTTATVGCTSGRSSWSTARFRRGVDLLGHRHLSVEPSHIDVWLNCSAMTSRPTVPNGRRFAHDHSVALAGFGIEPL